MRKRLRQYREASIAPAPADFALAGTYLPPALVAIFRAQHPRDVVHSANVARWLLARGHDSPELVAAALLHDVGKGHQRRSDRVAFVLLGAVGLGRFAASERSRLATRRALRRSLVHAGRGAAMLREADAGDRVVDLVLRHHSPPAGDAVLALLQQADAAN